MGNGILRYFGGTAQNALAAYDESGGRLCEVRLRAGRAMAITTEKGYAFLSSKGQAVTAAAQAVTITAEDIRRTFEALCRFSVHSFKSQISRGFVTVSGGHRAGICGTAVYSPDGSIESMKYISGINLRIAREVKGVADKLAELCASRQAG